MLLHIEYKNTFESEVGANMFHFIVHRVLYRLTPHKLNFQRKIGKNKWPLTYQKNISYDGTFSFLIQPPFYLNSEPRINNS